MSTAVSDFSGLVLSRKPYKEADLLVKMLTKEYGKRTFLVHRARKPGFKLAAGILPLTLGRYRGRIVDNGLSYLSDVIETRIFKNTADDLLLNAYSTYVLALFGQAFRDDEPLESAFDDCVAALQHIEDGSDPAVITNVVEVQLLETFGVAPNWRACVVGGETSGHFDYSEQLGGILCDKHWSKDPYRLHVSEKALFLLRRFSAVSLANLKHIAVSDSTKRELRRVLDRLYQDTVGFVPKAKTFLDKMQKGAPGLQPLRPKVDQGDNPS